MKPIPQETIQRICQLYSVHKSMRVVQKELNISIGSAHKYVLMNNLLTTNNIVKKLNIEDQRLIGVYIGLWMGDGTQYLDKGYVIKICSNQKDQKLN